VAGDGGPDLRVRAAEKVGDVALFETMSIKPMEFLREPDPTMAKIGGPRRMPSRPDRYSHQTYIEHWTSEGVRC
jgi:hypothetical protein